MLNKNLAKVRRERGLTQEALAVKLHVVRQTISKWENGTAVPDADTLCRIADALEVSVADLLGNPEQEDKMDTARIAKSLAEINEQLAVRNRQSSKILKVVCSIIIVIVALIIVVLNLTEKPQTSPNVDVEVGFEDMETIIELDENGIPLVEQIGQSNEHVLQEFFGSRNITDEQLIESWGNPVRNTDNSASWLISKDKVITVFFTDAHFAYECGIEGR